MVKQLTMKATKICPLTRTNRSFVWVILTDKTSKFIVFIDELNFRVRKLCHSQHNYLLLLCEHCEIMDREEECVYCHEIEQVANKNQEVMEYLKPNLPYDCITDNPGFHSVCLDRWVLQAVWLDYQQQYGSRTYEGPEHKIH